MSRWYASSAFRLRCGDQGSRVASVEKYELPCLVTPEVPAQLPAGRDTAFDDGAFVTRAAAVRQPE